ncbi:MAG: DNA starvation/stationary phase protection protein [Proteobacteria bacterium]|nr:DNA starvation/stationary phase protection protein [Pseudomonadota bacterium]
MAHQRELQGLKVLLANTYALYLKTQNYHWNVVGPQFHAYHLLFETEYKELLDAVDEIAERIRAKGQYSPGSFKEFSELKTIPEAKAKLDALGMIKDLSESHETICKSLHELLEKAKTENDDVTQDLILERMEFHEKTIWMLKSHLQH